MYKISHVLNLLNMLYVVSFVLISPIVRGKNLINSLKEEIVALLYRCKLYFDSNLYLELEGVLLLVLLEICGHIVEVVHFRDGSSISSAR